MGKLCDVCKYDGLPELDKPCVIYEDRCRHFERRVGSWIRSYSTTTGYWFKCDLCGASRRATFNYCPSCGAKMDEVVNNG